MVTPDFDSGWIDITGKQGQSITITHNLNHDNIIVDIIGRAKKNVSDHQKYLGLIGYIPGWSKITGLKAPKARTEMRSVVKTSDGGYATAGSIGMWSFLPASRVYLAKIDVTGTLQWEKEFADPPNPPLLWPIASGYSVVKTSDGGFAIVGSEVPNIGNSYVFLVKTDSGGNMQWSKTYGGDQPDFGHSVIQASDGGYVIAGSTTSNTIPGYQGGIDVYLIKTDAQGNKLWEKAIGGAGDDVGYSIIEATDGGFVIVGSTTSSTIPGYQGSIDVYLIKTDAQGNKLWEKAFGGTGDNVGYCVIQSNEGGYAIAGSTKYSGGNSDVYLIRTNSTGNVLPGSVGLATFGGTGDDVGYSIVQTSDGGYAIAGSTKSFGAGYCDVYLVKTDQNLNQLWQETYGGKSDDVGYSVINTSDGRYVIAGSTTSFGAQGSTNGYLVKTSVHGEFGLARTGSAANTLTLYRGANDTDWNYVRVRILKIQ